LEAQEAKASALNGSGYLSVDSVPVVGSADRWHGLGRFVASPNSSSSHTFLTSAHEILARVSVFPGSESAVLVREAEALIQELQAWKAADDDGRGAIIGRLLDLHRRSLEFVVRQGPKSGVRKRVSSVVAEMQVQGDADDDEAITAELRLPGVEQRKA
jgi:hypothetical protein